MRPLISRFANPRISRMRSVTRTARVRAKPLFASRSRARLFPRRRRIYEERHSDRKNWIPRMRFDRFPLRSPPRFLSSPPRRSGSRKLPSPITTCLAHKGKKEGEPTGFSSDTPDRSRGVCLALFLSFSLDVSFFLRFFSST